MSALGRCGGGAVELGRWRPSPRRGLCWVATLWRVVLAVWLAPSVLGWTLSVSLAGVVGPERGHSPAAETEVVLRAVADHGGWLLTVGLGVLVASWTWSVLWHAGVAGWAARARGHRAVLGELLGLGLSLWWRQAVMAATGLALTALMVAMLWVPMLLGGARAWVEGREAMVELLVWGALVVASAAAATSAAVTARATWAVPHVSARQLLILWPMSLAATLRQPCRSIGTVLVWAVPALVTGSAVLLVSWLRPELVTGAGLAALEQLAALAGAVCAVGLLGSFAPPRSTMGSRRSSADAG